MSLNSPFTHEEVKNLRMGFTASATYLGMATDENGKSYQRFAPTRKQRRASLQKSNNKRYHGRMVREQVVCWLAAEGRFTSRTIRHLIKPMA
jgi:hypothetical protein